MKNFLLGVAALAVVGAAWWLLGGAPPPALPEPSSARVAPNPVAPPAETPRGDPGPTAGGAVRAVPFVAADESDPARPDATAAAGAAPEDGPFIAGRLVDAAGRPVTRGEVRLTLGDHRERSTRIWASDDDGRFRAPRKIFPPRPPQNPDLFVVEVAPPHALTLLDRGRRYEPGTQFEAGQDRDLGDLVVDASRAVRVVVHEEGGGPVRRGFLARDAADVFAFQALDAQGGLDLHLPAEAVDLVVAADGYERGRFTVPAGVASPYTVYVRRAAVLAVTVRTPSGAPAPDLLVRLVGPRGFLGFTDPLHDALYESGRCGFDTGVGDGRELAIFRTDRRGRVRIGDLAPAVALRVEVTDPFGGFTTPLEALTRAGDPLELTATTPLEPRSFSLRARYADGKPAAGAMFRLEPAGGGTAAVRGRSEHAGADGVARFGNVYAAEGVLSIEALGRPKYRVAPFAFPGDGREAEFTLSGGREVLLVVVDAAGNPQPVEAAWAEHPDAGPTDGARGSSDGRVLLKGLPEDVVTLKARVGDEAYAVRHDAREPEARLTIPAHGKLVVRLGDAGRTKDLKVFVRLTPLDGGTQRLFVPGLQADLDAGELRVDAVRVGRYRAELLRDEGAPLPKPLAPFVDFAVEVGRAAEIRLGG